MIYKIIDKYAEITLRNALPKFQIANVRFIKLSTTLLCKEGNLLIKYKAHGVYQHKTN